MVKGESGELKGVTEAGMGANTKKTAALSSIIDVLNKSFGTDFSEADRLFFDQVEADILSDDELMKAARSNTMENFKFAFEDVFMGKVIDRMGMNDQIFAKLLDDQKFQRTVKNWIMSSVYQKLTQEAAPPSFTDR